MADDDKARRAQATIRDAEANGHPRLAGFLAGLVYAGKVSVVADFERDSLRVLEETIKLVPSHG